MEQTEVKSRNEISINLSEATQVDNVKGFEVRFGSLCPTCKKGIIDYDGMLNLVCPNCGFTSGGCFT